MPESPVAHLDDLRPLFLRAQRDERVSGLEESALEGAGHRRAIGQLRRRRQFQIVVLFLFVFVLLLVDT